MALPVGEVGVGVIGGGTLVALAVKLLPILLKRINGKNRDNRNYPRPGTAKICIEQGKKIVEHDVVIKHLCDLSDKVDKQMETARIENREDHGKMFEKLDGLKK